MDNGSYCQRNRCYWFAVTASASRRFTQKYFKSIQCPLCVWNFRKSWPFGKYSFSFKCLQANQLAWIDFPAKIRSWIHFDDLVFDGGQKMDPPSLIIIMSQLETFVCNFGISVQSVEFRLYYFKRNRIGSNSALKMINE